jgi:hypothetical protein
MYYKETPIIASDSIVDEYEQKTMRAHTGWEVDREEEGTAASMMMHEWPLVSSVMPVR